MGFKLYGKELVGKVFVSKNNYPISIDIDNEGYDVTVGERLVWSKRLCKCRWY